MPQYKNIRMKNKAFIYRVTPREYMRGVCPTVTDTLKSAVTEAVKYQEYFGLYCLITKDKLV